MEVYERLCRQLDEYSVGFPRTSSGVEMAILKRLFTPKEAELYLMMSLSLESPKEIAQRLNRPLEEISNLLDSMFRKGLVFAKEKGGEKQYGVVPFMVGFYEFQVKDMDRELAELFEQYFEEAFLKQASAITPPLRTVPVGKALDTTGAIAPYEDLREIVKKKDRIAITRCICRVQKRLVGKGCDKPIEACFSFGSHADYYVQKGMGRYISAEEALSIMDECEKVGLVPQPYNAQDPGGFCNCCGDCCGLLLALKKHPKPAQAVYSNYLAESKEELCIGCGVCVERCQMEAVGLEEDRAVVNKDRCIGCGLCVTTCPTQAMELIPKPKDRLKEPPPTARDTMIRLAKERGRSLIHIAFRGN